MNWKQLPFLLLMSAASVAAHADSTVYYVNLNANGATAVGTITTDINSGVLTTNDILGFSLTLAEGSANQTITNLNAYIAGTQFTATPDGLFYDFSNDSTTNLAAFVSDLSATSTALCFTGGANCPGSAASGRAYSSIRLDGNVTTAPESGIVQIATSTAPTPPSTVTPEPSSLALLGTGMIGLYGTARRRLA